MVRLLEPSAQRYINALPADKVVKVPEMAESISEGTLKQWSKQIGDYVEQDEEIATIETDKIDVAVNAPEPGTIKEFLANEEDTVTVGQDLLKLELGGPPKGGEKQQGGQEPKAPAPDDQSTSSDPKSQKDEGKPEQESPPPPPPTEKKPEPSKQESKPSPPPKEPPKQQESKKPEPKPKDTAPLSNREERRVKMNRMRLRISERLKQSQNTAASLTTFNEVDMSNLMQFRKLYKDEVLKKTGVKLGFMSAFSRACILAMRDIPAVNASIEGPGGGDTIVYRDYVDISVAVATEKGLVTPVVRNTEALDLIGIENAIAELGKKARDNKLTIEDMAGGTFTISNGGVFGSLMGTPIINLPQTAVLGLHAIKEKPVAIDGKVEIRPMMYLALTYDHRLLDGREAVVFLVKVKEYIEDPRRMLLG
ncbi:2-oxoglutarate dehydrogenase complex E2 component [Imshaugia aleurites]|uniref:dihydrolipoyllysine-residue succinyltransferase n=1 Tax=Imshaugia aleurites TaxID=172621 RepID=A0A8H3FN34_9LECA|nr:2-oxoglutarate dehydrogenase complex E2 component [Imshaugia aleurites]